MAIQSLFVTEIYHARLAEAAMLNPELLTSAYSLAEDDEAGKAWCEANAYWGYTSYGSLNDLAWRFPPFAQLAAALEPHVRNFTHNLELDLRGRELRLDSLWVNVLAPGGVHSGHIHPHSVISGTYYVRMPLGASSLRFEDPRLPMMMAAPPRLAEAAPERRTFAYVLPQEGDVILWESWLRHEATLNAAEEDRVSVSFNYAWG